jgi:peptide methionine sulfoxide reductase MsrB
MRKFSKNDDAVRKLPPDQYRVTHQSGIEVPGAGEYSAPSLTNTFEKLVCYWVFAAMRR